MKSSSSPNYCVTSSHGACPNIKHGEFNFFKKFNALELHANSLAGAWLAGAEREADALLLPGRAAPDRQRGASGIQYPASACSAEMHDRSSAVPARLIS